MRRRTRLFIGMGFSPLKRGRLWTPEKRLTLRDILDRRSGFGIRECRRRSACWAVCRLFLGMERICVRGGIHFLPRVRNNPQRTASGGQVVWPFRRFPANALALRRGFFTLP